MTTNANQTKTRANKRSIEDGAIRFRNLTPAERLAHTCQYQFRATAGGFVKAARWLASNLAEAAERVEKAVEAGDFELAHLGAAHVRGGSLYSDVRQGAAVMAALDGVLSNIEIRTDPANDADPAAACPRCGERDRDRLVWQDDATVQCEMCGHTYKP